ncbi:hypothetical protein [Acidithiobacillus ferrooxidans]|uniref:hypothetical protein n=1 Tax=Acidithiobacillus ferrooxidans TaxID=920 RepID=UPI0013D46EAE|nr:hypothetical protein [Acidithiobacillus ferrooxidans]
MDARHHPPIGKKEGLIWGAGYPIGDAGYPAQTATPEWPLRQINGAVWFVGTGSSIGETGDKETVSAIEKRSCFGRGPEGRISLPGIRPPDRGADLLLPSQQVAGILHG